MLKINFALLVFLIFTLFSSGCVPRSAVMQSPDTETVEQTPLTALSPTDAPSAPTFHAQPSETQLPAPTATKPSLPNPGALDGALGTYTNRKEGFLLDYPAGWTVTDVSQTVDVDRMYSVTLVSPVPNRGPKQQEGLAPGVSKIDVNINMTEHPISYEVAVIYWRGQITGGEFPSEIISEQEGQLPSGLLATRWVIQPLHSDTPVVWVLTSVQGNIINLVGMGDLVLVDKVIATIRPVE